MRIQLTRDCVIGPSDDRNNPKCGKAGQVIDTPEKNAKELLRVGAATDKITAK
jgi:hypothetical protein